MTSRTRFQFRLRFTAIAFAILSALVIGAAQTALAQTYSVIHTFSGSDGIDPTSTLVQDRAGNFYGTTESGGSSGGSAGAGVLFQLKRAGSGWIFVPLHDFGQPVSYGTMPLNYGGLTFGPDGILYGSASYGGLLDCGQSYCGVVFRLQPPATACRSALCPWDYSLMYQFTNVEYPEGNVVFDTAGNLYGTTEFGGVYEISPSNGGWTESLIGAADGEINGGMVIDGAGNLYGVWGEGYQTKGGVFELSPTSSGWTETVLYSFTGGSDGALPVGGLIFDNAGNLYGSTSTGGIEGGGTLFELLPSGSGWTFKLLWSLPGSANSGPQSALTMDSQGDLYGTTVHGGAHGGGSVFKGTRIGNNWVVNDLYDFQQGSNGVFPVAGVTLDSQGNLYGTTSSGGNTDACYDGCGVIWEITP
jgi:hypothetical protein